MSWHSFRRLPGASSVSPSHRIFVQQQDFDPGVEEQQLRAIGASVGASVAFTGYVRDHHAGSAVRGMTLEHYPGMTEKSIATICDTAAGRWPLQAISVIHRVGHLLPGERIVYVGVASAHRQAAFEAAEFIMDYLKTRAPFWKKERLDQGERWVEARTSDDEAARRW